MTTAIQLLRSDQDNLRPEPTTLADGMPMINTNQDSPGLFFKLGDNTLTKIGPTHVGATAPNVAPRGYAGNCLGELWLDTSDPTFSSFKVWDGSQWVEIGFPSAPFLVTTPNQTVTLPANPTTGEKVMISVYGDNILNTVVARNGSNIMGLAQDLTLNIPYARILLIFMGGSQGWNIG